MVIAYGWADDIRKPLRPGSMGLPLPGWSTAVLGDSSDTVLPAGQLGRVVIRVADSRLMWFTGYTDAPNKTTERVTDDGQWYR